MKLARIFSIDHDKRNSLLARHEIFKAARKVLNCAANFYGITSTMITVYGIPNCDSVKTAKKWLEANNVPYTFHDFRQDGIDSSIVANWLENEAITTDTLLNKRSTTWKQLSEATQALAANDTVALLVQHPALIKRPVLISAKTILVGFKDAAYQQLINEES